MRIKSPFPFHPNFDALLTKYLESEETVVSQIEDLQEVRVRMVGRGKPKDNAYVCLPTKGDLEKYMKAMQDNDSRIHAVHEEDKLGK